MKSIIQEAASIAKAVEQSWQRAGKPQKFSIKVLEVEERNFLGMVKKPAKIAFFFEDSIQPVKRKVEAKSKQKMQQKQSEKKLEKKPIKTVSKSAKKPVKKTLWSDQMVDAAQNWTQDMLNMMKLSHVKFSTKTFRNTIKFHFEAPLMQNKNEQKILFSSFALLLMQTLRNKFKKQFRNLSVVFIAK